MTAQGRRGDEAGAGTVFGLAFLAVIAVAAVVAIGVAAIVLAHRRAESAADLAAIAAASGFQRGVDPCSEAQRVALANAAEMTGCTMDGPNAIVEVASVASVGIELSMPARARAGPEGLTR